MAEAVVEYAYTAIEADELTIQKGDIISNIKQMDGGWWEGMLRGKTGVFPDNFVKLLDSSTQEKQPNVTLRKDGQRKCRVLFSYKPLNEDELELHENDVIDVLGEVEEGWWRGKLKNKVGVFPSNFVREETSSDAPPLDKQNEPSAIMKKKDSVDTITNGGNHQAEGPSLPPKPSREYCRVRFSYTAVNQDELSLHVGDVVTLLSKQTQEPGWWRGELAGKLGVFPDNFVEVISADEACKVTPLTTKVHVNPPEDPTVKGATEEAAAPPVKKPLAPPASKKPVASQVAPPCQPPPPVHPPPSLKPTGKLAAVDSTDSAVPPQSSEFDHVDRSAMLTHITVSRVKAPRRRPPSTVYKESESGSTLVNGGSSNNVAEEPTLPVVLRNVPKVPWVQELRMSQLRPRKPQPEPEKKPVPPAVLIPTKPSEARLKATPVAPPATVNRSPQQVDGPLSSPRRISPAAEAPQPVKRPDESKPTNGVADKKPVAGQRPPSLSLDVKDQELKELKEKVLRMEAQLSRVQDMLNSMENLVKKEREERRRLEQELCALKELVSHV